MRCILQSEPLLNELRVRLEINNYTDSMPLIQEIIFRKQAIRTSSQAFALAIAILISEYCGDFFEIPHLTVGRDYVEAIRAILGGQTNITPVNGEARALASNDTVVFSRQAGSGIAAFENGLHEPRSVPLVCIDWFDDFVDPISRNSLSSQIGMYYTNAMLVAGSEFVSVAMALIHGGDNVGRIMVPMGSNPLTIRHLRVTNGLRLVAVDLEWVDGR